MMRALISLLWLVTGSLGLSTTATRKSHTRLVGKTSVSPELLESSFLYVRARRESTTQKTLKVYLDSLMEKSDNLDLFVEENPVVVSSDEAEEAFGAPIERKTNAALWRCAMLAITMCWATNFALLKFGVEALPEQEGVGSLFVACRFFIASLACLPFAFGASEPGVLVAGARIGAWCASGYAAQAIAENSFGADASTTAFLCSLQSVVVAVAAFASAGNFDFGSSETKRTVTSVALGILGVGVLCFGSSDAGFGGLGLGEVIALGQAVGFGASYLELEEATRKYPEDSTALAAVQCIVVGAASVAQAATSTHQELGAFVSDVLQTPAALGSLLWMGLISTAFTIWIQTLVFKKTPASDASIILVTEPLWAALCAHFLLGENLNTMQLAGGVAVLAACAVNEQIIDLFPEKHEEKTKIQDTTNKGAKNQFSFLGASDSSSSSSSGHQQQKNREESFQF